MVKRGAIAGVLAIALALAVPVLSRAQAPMCTGQHSVGGWSQMVAQCSFTAAGDRLSIAGLTDAAGIYTSYLVPFPAITSVTVSIVSGGETLLSCTSTDLLLSRCTRNARLSILTGTSLTCVVRAWTNLSYGAARTVHTCASR